MSESDSKMDWTRWTLRRWNEALVDAVFVALDGAPRSITRIDVTNAFLARIVGAASSDEDAVRSSFVRCVRTEVPVRLLFHSSEQCPPWKPSLAQLPFFAQLYFSLMVAGADESTHELGNFRERLATMLDAPEAAHLHFNGLPALWKAAQRWTRKTVRPSIRQLELPNPDHEKIIGYSKRLAFPCYRDQKRLSELLSKRDLTGQSPAWHIIQAVDVSLADFTKRFQDEFSEFKALYRGVEYARALASPFWGAIQDMTWTAHAASGDRSNRGKFLLELDIIDAHAPTLLLRSDNALSPRHLPWRSVHRNFYRDGYPHEIFHGASSGAASPDALQSAAARAIFGRSRALQHLSKGCVAFVQDEFGAWVDVNALSEGQSFWLLLSRARGDRLRARFESAARKPEVCGSFGSSQTWMLMGPLTFRESLRQLIAASIDDPMFEHRLVAPRIAVIGGLQLPEGYLFLPGCSPHAFMKEAASFRWSATASAAAPSSGELIPESVRGERIFRFADGDSRERLPACRHIDVVALDGEGNVLDQKPLRVVTECNSWSLKPPRERGRWRELGNAGDLAGLEDVGRTISHPASAHLDVKPVVASNERWNSPREIDIDAMPQHWQEIVEILTATFMRVGALPAQDLLELVRRAWGMDIREAWSAIQDLVDNGLVEQLFNRQWHGIVFLARSAKAVMTVVEDRVHVRVIGLAPAVLRREIAARARAMQGRLSMFIDPLGQTCGVLHVQLSSAEHAEAMCQELDLSLELHSRNERELSFAPWTQLLAPRALRTTGELSLWSAQRGSFVSDSFPLDEWPQLEQWRREGAQPLYVLRTPRHLWHTHSRIWALLAREALAGGTLAEIATDGSVRLSERMLSLPPTLAREVLRRGGGVCYRDEKGRRTYPAAVDWKPASMMSAWVRRLANPMERNSAREQLRAALASATGMPMAVLRRYWASPQRTR